MNDTGVADAPAVSPTRRRADVAVYVIVAVGLFGTFLLDARTAMGPALGILYLPWVALSARPRDLQAVAVVTASATALALLAYLVKPESDEPVDGWIFVANRAFAIVGVVLVGGLCAALITTERRGRASTAALRSSALELQSWFDVWDLVSRVSRLGAWSVDLRTRQVVLSAETCRIYGMPEGYRSDIDDSMRFYPPGYRERAVAVFRRCAEDGRPFDEDLEIEQPDGTRVPVRVLGTGVRDASGAVVKVQGTMRDLTPHPDDELAEQRSMRRLIKLADALPVNVWMADPDGRPEYFSERLLAYSGLDRDRLATDEGILTLVHPDDRGAWMTELRRALSDGDEIDVEVRLRRHDGVFRRHLARSTPVRDDDGRIVQWYGSAMDVHDIRELEEESRRLGAQLTMTLESMSDAFLLLDEEFRLTYANGMGIRMIGDGYAESLGRPVWETFPLIVGTPIEDAYRRTVATGESTRFRASVGPSERTIEGVCYRNDTGIAVYVRDVSDELALELRVQRSERLESLGQLTGGVAHDFNNLLTVVMGGAGLLREELGADHPCMATVDLIESAAQRGADLTARLLAFSRRQPLEPRPVDLRSLVGDVHGLLERTLGEHIEVTVRSEPDLPAANVDPGQLENALINVCLNSRDAMPAGGRLTIELSTLDVDAGLAARMEVDPGRFVVVGITDTGTGIAPEHLSRLFEPFFTTKSGGTGTGLGLPMVYGLLKQSGGHVSVYSEPGQGTTVRMYLPVSDEAGFIAPEPERDDAVRGGDEVVLVVEDDALVLRFAEEQLTRFGYTVITAADGPDAIDVLHSDTHLDLLLTDVVLPGEVSGRVVADAAAALRPGLPVLFTSGYSADVIVHEGRLDEGVDLLSKPYPAHELAVRVRQALDRP